MSVMFEVLEVNNYKNYYMFTIKSLDNYYKLSELN